MTMDDAYFVHHWSPMLTVTSRLLLSCVRDKQRPLAPSHGADSWPEAPLWLLQYHVGLGDDRKTRQKLLL
jgi:hypothetical protein